MNFKTEVIARIRAFRRMLEITQDTVSKKMGKERTFISNIEAVTLTKNMKLGVLDGYLDALGYRFTITIHNKKTDHVVDTWV